MHWILLESMDVYYIRGKAMKERLVIDGVFRGNIRKIERSFLVWACYEAYETLP